MATDTKDVEMKDVEDKKSTEEATDPKQGQKDKDLLLFEGNLD